MRWIVGTSMQLRFLILLLAAALVIVGVIRVRQLPIDVLPEFSPPYVEVQTEALGLSAEEVEALITVPIEELLNGVPWLQNMRSESVVGLSSIVLLFEPGTDLARARQLVQERLTQAQAIPSKKVAKAPVMLQPLSSASRVTMIGLSSQELSLIDLSVLARWNIKPRLMGVPGVANVAVWGQRERQLQVQVDPARLHAQGVSLDQVIETAGNALWVSPLTFLEASTPGSGGFIDTPNQRLGIRHVLPISTPADLAQVPLEGCAPGSLAAQVAVAQVVGSQVVSSGCGPSGAPLRLGEVATIVEDHQPLIGDAMVAGSPGLVLVIEKFPKADSAQVTRGVEEALAALKPGLPGVEINTSLLRPATFIERALDNLGLALLVGFALVALVLFAFFRSWRSGVVSLVTIPVALSAALLALQARGATLNVMVLVGFVIALGVLIDDAIIDVENIVRRLRQHRREGSTKSTARIILEASLEVRNAIVYATLISALAVMPVFFLEGLSGAFFRPLALSYALAMLASMVVALTVTPALSLLLFSGKHSVADATKETATGVAATDADADREPALQRGFGRAYETVVAPLIGRPAPAFLLIGLIVLAGAFTVPRLSWGSLLPDLKETDLLIRWDGSPGTSRIAMNETATKASRELEAVPGVSHVTAHLGRAVTGDKVVGISAGEIWINLDPKADYDTALADIQNVLTGYPALQRGLRDYSQGLTDEALAGVPGGLVVRVYGHDLGTLREKAGEVQRALTTIGGISGAQVEGQVKEPIMEVEANLEAAQRYGLKPGDVRRAATTLVNGLEVGNLFETQKVFDVLVVGTPEVRGDLSDIENLLIDTPAGEQVRLSEVAEVRITPTPNVINREGASRRIDVQANVAGRPLNEVVRDVERALADIEFPLEYHPEVLGEYAELQNAQRSLLGFVLAAVVGIFLLLQASFRSWRLATLAFLALPAALCGGVLAAYLSGGVISLGSLVGFLTVLGIAARNGIMLINHYQHLEQQEGETFGLALILRGARERLVPILMTALVTGLAMLPLVAAGSIPGHEIEHPMAVVILGGLVTSTLLNLFIIPPLYLRFGRVYRRAATH